jgi:hypothetical protein
MSTKFLFVAHLSRELLAQKRSAGFTCGRSNNHLVMAGRKITGLNKTAIASQL